MVEMERQELRAKVLKELRRGTPTEEVGYLKRLTKTIDEKYDANYSAQGADCEKNDSIQRADEEKNDSAQWTNSMKRGLLTGVPTIEAREDKSIEMFTLTLANRADGLREEQELELGNQTKIDFAKELSIKVSEKRLET